MKSLRIWWLKRQLRAAYQAYHSQLDGMSCGAAIGCLINPRAEAARNRCNSILQKLAILDPENCPASRIA